MTDGSDVPIRDVNGGFDPYVPWTVLISAGLMGAASDRSRTEEDGMEGEMECEWSLLQIEIRVLDETNRRNGRHT